MKSNIQMQDIPVENSSVLLSQTGSVENWQRSLPTNTEARSLCQSIPLWRIEETNLLLCQSQGPKGKDSAFAGMQWAWPLEFSLTREQKEEKLASRGDRQSNFFMISSKACFLISQKLFMETWPQDGRSYLQKAGIVMELVMKYLVLKVWKLLLGIEQREYLLLVVWNQSHHQNYLQIPKIKDEQCYI